LMFKQFVPCALFVTADVSYYNVISPSAFFNLHSLP